MLAVVALCAREAAAFPLSATPGDTLAVVAQRVYNRGENERVLAAAKGLERLGSSALPAGTRIEVPTDLSSCRAGRDLGRAGRRLAPGQYNGQKDVGLAPRQLVLRAAVQRLLEAYAALGASGRAADGCREWRLAAPQAKLDPRELSPKLLAAGSAAR